MKEKLAKILVTGGAGFIGSWFVKMLLDQFPQKQLIVLDALTYAGNLENLAGILDTDNVLFVKGDVCDPETVRKLVRSVDAIVHFAAETHVDRSILFADQFIRTDIYGTYCLLEASKESPVKKFLYVSSDEVYGERCDPPPNEEAPFSPKSPYAASKAGADCLSSSYYHTYGVPVAITRCVNNYGPYQHPEKLIPLFITQALQDKPLPVYGDGSSSREWLHVKDHCRALLEILFRSETAGETFNIGSGERKTVLEIAREILKLLHKPEDLIHFVKDRPGHAVQHTVNAEKLKSSISFQPSISFQEGLKETIEWYKSNEGWWRRIKADKSFEAFAQSWYRERIAL